MAVNGWGARKRWRLLIAVAFVAGACGGNGHSTTGGAGPASAEEQVSAQADGALTEEPDGDPAGEALTEEPDGDPAGEALTEEPDGDPADGALTEEPDGDPAGDALTEEPDGDPAGEAASEPTPVVLTASYQGVTEAEIAIGAAAIDMGQINEMFGVEMGVFSEEKLYAAMADDLNKRGGINGRNVVVHVSLFLPIGEADSERVCTELVEDKKVFVVIGQFVDDHSLCVTELHGHPYVGHWGETFERPARSRGLFFGVEMDFDDIVVAAVAEMIRAGDLEGFNVGVFYGALPGKTYADAAEALLDDAGITVVGAYSTGPAVNDTVADQQALENVAQRMRSDGVDLVLSLASPFGIALTAQNIGWDVPIAIVSGQAAGGTSVLDDLSISDEVLARTFAVTVNRVSREEALADPGVQHCVGVYNERFGDEPLDLSDEEIVLNVTNHCRGFALTVMILEAAGANLTPETFVAAGEGLGTFDLPAMAGATLSADKHSAGSLIRRYEYVPEARTWLPVGDPIQSYTVE